MALVREATHRYAGFAPGDIKVAHYDITFTAHQLVEPVNDPGWFLLNGAVISQTNYATLFNLFGTSFNTGSEGTGFFRLPELTAGRQPLSRGLTNFPTLGATGGEINHTLTTAELPSHSHGHNFTWTSGSHGHGIVGSVAAGGAHTHATTNTNVTGLTVSRNGNPLTANTFSSVTGSTTGADSGHSHGITLVAPGAATSSVSITGSVGGLHGVTGGSAHNNMQPYIVIGGWLVKYK